MDEKNPEVSVLIPAYNAQNFIQRTIESALRQTFQDLEIIIVDDGSKDETPDIIRAMQRSDTRVNYYYQENQGLSNTRNRLMKLARGEFVAFLDHDDEWLPGKIEKQIKLFGKDRRIGLVFSDAYIKRNGKIIGTCFKERKPFRNDIFYKYLFSDNFVPLLTAMAPRQVLAKFMPFNPEYRISEEFDMFLKVAREHMFDYVEEPLAIYHLHENNTVISESKRLIEEDFSILDFWLNRDPSISRLYKKELNYRLSQLYCRRGLYFLENKDLSEAAVNLFKSFKHKLFNCEAIKLSVKLTLNILRVR